jgi:hypothetical protein
MSDDRSQCEVSSADTQEFEAIRSVEGTHKRTEFELVGNYRLPIKVDFQHPIELRFGRDDQTPTCYLIRNPTPFEHEGPFVLVQPDVVRRSPGRGWATLGGPTPDGLTKDLLRVGRAVSPQFDLGPDVSRHHCLITIECAKDYDLLEVETYGRNGVRVLLHPGDLAGKIDSFDPDEN